LSLFGQQAVNDLLVGRHIISRSRAGQKATMGNETPQAGALMLRGSLL
jgi:hypothetical protein